MSKRTGNMEHKELEDRGWAAMHEILDSEMPRKKRRAAIWWLLGTAAVVLFAVLVFSDTFSGDLAKPSETAAIELNAPKLKTNDQDGYVRTAKENLTTTAVLEAQSELSEINRPEQEADGVGAPIISKGISKVAEVAELSTSLEKMGTRMPDEIANTDEKLGLQTKKDQSEISPRDRIDPASESVPSRSEASPTGQVVKQQNLPNTMIESVDHIASDTAETDSVDEFKSTKVKRMVSVLKPVVRRPMALIFRSSSRDPDFYRLIVANKNRFRFNVDVLAGIFTSSTFSQLGGEVGVGVNLSKGRWTLSSGISYWSIRGPNQQYSASQNSIGLDQVFVKTCPCNDRASDVEAGLSTSLDNRTELESVSHSTYWELPLLVRILLTPRLGVYAGGAISWRSGSGKIREPELEFSSSAMDPSSSDLRSLMSQFEQVSLFRSSTIVIQTGVDYQIGNFLLDLGAVLPTRSHLNYSTQSLDLLENQTSSNPLNRYRLRLGYRF